LQFRFAELVYRETSGKTNQTHHKNDTTNTDEDMYHLTYVTFMTWSHMAKPACTSAIERKVRASFAWWE